MMEYFKFFTELWRFFKKYYGRAGKERDYEECVQECENLAESFENSKFAIQMCGVVLEELDRCWKSRKEA